MRLSALSDTELKYLAVYSFRLDHLLTWIGRTMVSRTLMSRFAVSLNRFVVFKFEKWIVHAFHSRNDCCETLDQNLRLGRNSDVACCIMNHRFEIR